MASNERDAISWYQKKVMSVFFICKAYLLYQAPSKNFTLISPELGGARYSYMIALNISGKTDGQGQ